MRTERAVERRFFGSGDAEAVEYAELLAAFLGVYRPLERHLAPAVGRHLPSFAFRRRTPRLESDLRSLGLGEETIETLPILEPVQLPDLQDGYAVLGCLYVVEGSQLGHRVLWERLRPALDGSSREADAFFGVSAAGVRARWEQFRELFDQRVSTDGAVSAAVTAGRATFRAYREWLS